jgi:hypothetical protein
MLRKWLKILVKVVVSTLEEDKSSWSPHLIVSWRTECFGIHDKRMIHPNGPREMKGEDSLGYVGCGEERWWIGTVVGVWNLGLGLLCVESGQPRGPNILVDL